MDGDSMMRTLFRLFCLLSLAAMVIPAATAERRGTVTVGEDSWILVPSVQCSIYPGNIVSIAGHAAEDESLQLVIDYGGPTGVRVGDGPDAWHAQPESIKVHIEGKRIQGTATFFRYSGSPDDTRQGSFDVSCS